MKRGSIYYDSSKLNQSNLWIIYYGTCAHNGWTFHLQDCIPIVFLLSAFGVTIMRIAYGFEDLEKNQSLIHDVERLIVTFIDAVTPGRYLVSSFPLLKHIPSWFPGAGFKRHFQALAKELDMTVYLPFEDAKQNFASFAHLPMSSICY